MKNNDAFLLSTPTYTSRKVNPKPQHLSKEVAGRGDGNNERDLIRETGAAPLVYHRQYGLGYPTEQGYTYRYGDAGEVMVAWLHRCYTVKPKSLLSAFPVPADSLVVVPPEEVAAAFQGINYWNYFRFATSIKRSGPLPMQVFNPIQWDIMTALSVIEHWDWTKARTRAIPTHNRFQDSDDRDGGWAGRQRPRRHTGDASKDSLVADCLAVGLRIGRLRVDGSVGRDVTTKAKLVGERDRKPLSRETVTSRTCHECKKLLPLSQFYRNRVSLRSRCKSCERDIRRAKRVGRAAVEGRPNVESAAESFRFSRALSSLDSSVRHGESLDITLVPQEAVGTSAGLACG